MIAESRAEIAAALIAAGIRCVPAPSGQLSPPCVVLSAGSPWLSPAQLAGQSLVRWRLVCVAGRVDATGVWAMLDDLVAEVWPAVRALPGVLTNGVNRPSTSVYGEVGYLTAAIDIEHLTT